MSDVLLLTGAGQIGLAITRRVGSRENHRHRRPLPGPRPGRGRHPDPGGL